MFKCGVYMSRDQMIGGLLATGSVVGILVYGWLIFLAESWVSLLVLKLTGFIAVAGVLGILAWIGYTLATTPPPKPIEEIEKELEEELKKLEEETKEEEKKEQKTDQEQQKQEETVQEKKTEDKKEES